LVNETVRYRPGAPIDTSKILSIVGLKDDQWGPIEEAYPEIQAVGSKAPFRHAPTAVIFPPSYAPQKQLKAMLDWGSERTIVYGSFPAGSSDPTAVLVYVIGNYLSIHIYRLQQPIPKRRRFRRR
jgi:hypothetical protein